EDAQQAERLLLDHLAKGLSGIADKVCFTVSFDTSIIQEYRLLGFDNRHSTQKDTAFRFEGSSVASANAQLVLFEIIPKKDSIGIENLANVHINYCLPGQSQIKKMSYDCPNKPGPFETATPPLKKAVCIALFGMKLKGSEYTAQFSWADIDKMTRKVFSSGNYIDRDYMTLMARARKIYEHAQ
ncbi:MAG: YfbK domain-containing protein, partial [Chitinophaga rupis]